MPTLLPHDSDNNPIPAMRFKAGGAHVLTASGVSARTVTAFDTDTRIVSLYAEMPVYIAFGDDTVTASTADHYFPAGVYYDLCIGGDRTGHALHMAVMAVSAGGNVYVSEKE